jgi:pimeloyl-ACP methyl ester carboxylesterase
MELEYETFGSPDDETILLVMGYTAQLIAWPDDFCKGLANRGFQVVRYDNRDCGLSTKLDGVKVDMSAVMAAMAGGPKPTVPYTLSDFAADGIGLLDHLGVRKAHVVGASMGGMIVQTMAIEHPDRVASLTSVMSSTNEPEFGRPEPEAMAALLMPPPTDRQGFIDAAPRYLIFASKKYGDASEAKVRAALSYDRSFYPEGATRQMAAIVGSADRTEQLKALNVPTLVIHGRDDTLISLSGGERTAELIPGAHLLVVGDMGHDMPAPLLPMLVDSIAGHCARA